MRNAVSSCTEPKRKDNTDPPTSALSVPHNSPKPAQPRYKHAASSESAQNKGEESPIESSDDQYVTRCTVLGATRRFKRSTHGKTFRFKAYELKYMQLRALEGATEKELRTVTWKINTDHPYAYL